jgi:hypothetical protein
LERGGIKELEAHQNNKRTSVATVTAKKENEQEEGEMVGGHGIGSFKALGLRLRWRRGQHIS